MRDEVTEFHDPLGQLRFAALRNIFYHNTRRATLLRAHRGISFAVLISGTATATSLLKVLGLSEGNSALWLGGLTTVLGGLGLVYNYSDRANEHGRLAEKYVELLGSIDVCVNPDDQCIAGLKKRFSEISVAEPPVFRAAMALAHNEALQAIYGDDAGMLRVGFWSKLLSNCWRFTGAIYREKMPYTELQS